MRNVIKAVCVIIGTIIGAGFASGREIYIFFNRFGKIGILGLFIASSLTGVVIYKVLTHLKKGKAKNYNEYIEGFGIRKRVREVLGIIINIFLLISFYIMTAGFSAYFKQEFNIPPISISIIMAVLCHFTFIKSIEGVTKINTILIPSLIVMIVILGVKNGFAGIQEFLYEGHLENTKGWLISSIEYASYNSILLIPILIGLRKYSKGKEKQISIISSLIFFTLAIILYTILLNGVNNIQNIELPLIYIINNFGSLYKYICGIIVVAAIFTSAIAAGYGFLENTAKTKKEYKTLATIICTSSILVSKIGFSYLVNLLYPVFGLISFGQIFLIIKKK